MKGRRRGAAELDEAESYYISMTDMMVGVLFIFIILLSFFALQFHATTAALTQAKDAQTAVLLKIATSLEKRDATLEVDRAHRVVCIPGAILTGASDATTADRRCFAFSDSVLSAAERAAAKGAQGKSGFIAALKADVASQALPVGATVDDGGLTFPADKLFLANSTTLSPDGQATAQQVADILSRSLPCYGYGVTTTTDCSTSPKMSVVNVAGQAGFDAFSQAGRAAVTLALERSVAFHDALIRAQPTLGQIRSAPAAAAQPLLRVSTYGQSDTAAPAAGAGQTISMQFNMAQ